MRTVVLGPRPAELDALLARRRALGQDIFDEVWSGDYHLVPVPAPAHGYLAAQLAVALGPHARTTGLVGLGQFNLGDDADDFRVPDAGYHRGLPTKLWVPTAAVVVEVVSPDDETYAKFDFHARHHVDELLVADPDAKTIRCWHLAGTGYEEATESRLLGIGMAELVALIDWP